MNTSDWIPVLFNVVGKSAILLTGAGLLTFLLRRSSCYVRHLIWLLAVGGLLCLPFGLLLPKLEVPLGINKNSFALSAPGDVSTAVSSQTSDDLVIDLSATEMEVSRSGAWLSPVIAIWLTGVVLLLFQLLSGLLSVRRLRENCDPAGGSINYAARQLEVELGIKRQALILIAPEGRRTVPMTMGMLRPVIVLPSDASDWREEYLRTVLLHELGHIRRFDFLWNALAQLTCALYWFNPLIWLAVKRLRIESEHLVDELVIGHGIERSDYAQILLDTVGTLRARNLGAEFVQVSIARQPEINERLTEILAARKERRSISKGRLTFVSAISMGLLILLAIIQPVPRAEMEYRVANEFGGTAYLADWSLSSTEIQQSGVLSIYRPDVSAVRTTEPDRENFLPTSPKRRTSPGQPAHSVQEVNISQKSSPAQDKLATDLSANTINSSPSTTLSPSPAFANSGGAANPAKSGRPAKLPAPSNAPKLARPEL